MKLARCWIVLVGALAVVPAQGGVVFDHPPLNTGGLAADTVFLSFGFPLWQRVADDLILDQAETIRSIRFWGFYGSTFDDFPEPAPDTETMRVRFYGARPADGLPDETSILFEESFVNPAREATGRVIGTGPAPPEYVYDITLMTPLVLEPNTPYWLEIVQLGNLQSHFRWEVSVADRTGQAFINETVGDWQSTLPQLDADTAFQLSTVPEPSVLGLLLLGVFLAGRRRSRKEVRDVSRRV